MKLRPAGAAGPYPQRRAAGIGTPNTCCLTRSRLRVSGYTGAPIWDAKSVNAR
jgi:hypothetical protein